MHQCICNFSFRHIESMAASNLEVKRLAVFMVLATNHIVSELVSFLKVTRSTAETTCVFDRRRFTYDDTHQVHVIYQGPLAVVRNESHRRLNFTAYIEFAEHGDQNPERGAVRKMSYQEYAASKYDSRDPGLADREFLQFHPRACIIPAAPDFNPLNYEQHPVISVILGS